VGTDGDVVVSDGDEVGFGVIRDEQYSAERRQGRLFGGYGHFRH
jgi:hypothetical protein